MKNFKTYINESNNQDMIIITPDEKDKENNSKSIFLAGTIDNGDSLNWQDKVIIELTNLGVKNLVVYNPRQKNWNSNPSNDELIYQIQWEQDHLDNANVIAMVLLDNSKSPISLLELGLYAKSNKLIVFCTPNFYRWDNIRLTCEKYNIPLIEDITPSTIVNKIIEKL